MKACLSVQQNELVLSYLGPESVAGRVGALGLVPALIIPSAPCPYRCLHSPFLTGRSQGIPVFREGSQIPLFIFFSQVKSPKHRSIQVISLLMALHGCHTVFQTRIQLYAVSSAQQSAPTLPGPGPQSGCTWVPTLPLLRPILPTWSGFLVAASS